jgi:glutamate racemase
MASKKIIGIIGGTHFDAHLGVDIFRQYGLETVGAGISDTPEEATSLQVLSPLKLHRLVVNRMLEMKRNLGIETVCIYCNSMSTAIESEEAALETGMRVVTPLEVYRMGADQYRRIGLIAANCQSLGGIEKVIQEQNEAAQVIGAAMLEIAIEIEKKTDPRQIVRSLGIVHLIRFFEAADVDVLILGCTHFPILQSTLEGLTSLPILNPAAEMVRLCQM